MRSLILFLLQSTLILSIQSCSFWKVTNNDTVALLSIEQQLVQPIYQYQIINDRLVINENKDDKWKKRYSKKLDRNELQLIESFIENIQSLKSIYEDRSLGGVAWQINTNLNGMNKDVYVKNTKVKEVYDLCTFLNELIPSNKPRIITEPL